MFWSSFEMSMGVAKISSEGRVNKVSKRKMIRPSRNNMSFGTNVTTCPNCGNKGNLTSQDEVGILSCNTCKANFVHNKFWKDELTVIAQSENKIIFSGENIPYKYDDIINFEFTFAENGIKIEGKVRDHLSKKRINVHYEIFNFPGKNKIYNKFDVIVMPITH